jgi:hypothetical protein
MSEEKEIPYKETRIGNYIRYEIGDPEDENYCIGVIALIDTKGLSEGASKEEDKNEEIQSSK